MRQGADRAALKDRANDLYETPACAVHALLRVERLPHKIWEPCAGRGAIVRIELSASGLSVTGQATALDDGAEGDSIRVQNMSSKAFLFAQVIGPGQVRVTPDAPAAFATAPARFDRPLVRR